MDSENSYSQSLRILPDEELYLYVNKPEDYHDEAVIAAIIELQKRGITDSVLTETLSVLEEKKRQYKLPVTEEVVLPSDHDEQAIPVLYSKSAIRLFSILFSTLFGGILLAINFSRINKRKEILYVIAFSLLFSYATGLLVTHFPDYITVVAILMNLLGLLILEKVFWKRIIGDELEYISQPIWTTLGISILLSILLLWTMMK